MKKNTKRKRGGREINERKGKKRQRKKMIGEERK